MALDGIFLSALRDEIESLALGGRVDKIHQPAKDDVILSFRVKHASTQKLLLRVSSCSPRVNFTQIPLENPKHPPMFCMLLRKLLQGAKLVDVSQHGSDRILFLTFSAVNELGDLVLLKLAVEIMGRHSNLIIIGADGIVIDAIKRVSHEMSRVRPIVPGTPYTLPPTQDKCSPLTTPREVLIHALQRHTNLELSKAILAACEGVSPLLAREAAFVATGGAELTVGAVSAFRFGRLYDFFQQIANGEPTYTVILEDGKPKDFTRLDITQYGSYLEKRTFPTASNLLDYFFSERDRIERMKQRSHDLLSLLVNLTDRTARKLALQQQELLNAQDRNKLKQYGDLLNANLYALTGDLKRGAKQVSLPNFYDPEGAMVTIPLDPRKTPVQNAQKYYAAYRKAKTAEEKLTALIQQGEAELLYLDSIFDAVSRTTGESELLEIRTELIAEGYLKRHNLPRKPPRPTPPLSYTSSDGYTILCGRNNIQNDKLTLKTARNYDLWLHVKDIPGSHVVIQSQGTEFPQTTIQEAAVIAAYHSKARESSSVPVDYTLIRYVKKPSGAKPGMVIYTHQQTLYVTPSPPTPSQG